MNRPFALAEPAGSLAQTMCNILKVEQRRAIFAFKYVLPVSARYTVPDVCVFQVARSFNDIATANIFSDVSKVITNKFSRTFVHTL